MSVTKDHLNEVPQGDLNIFPLSENIDFEELRSYNEKFSSSCLFTLDSEKNSSLSEQK